VKLTIAFQLTPHLLASRSADTLGYLLSKGESVWQSLSLEEHIAHVFGVQPQMDYPLAAMAACEDGVEVAQAYWLRADPVHLLMQRDSFSLTDPVPLPMTKVQAQTLLSDLNAHFQAQQMTFVQGHSGRWYLRLPSAPNIKTTFPEVAVGQSALHYMPEGAAASQWRSHLNEIQMLLYTHPVNVERELSGLPVVNSLWLSGGGVMVERAHGPTDVSLCLANDPVYRGLARWQGVSVADVPYDMAELLSRYGSDDHVWVHALPEFLTEGAGCQALLGALTANKIQQLVIHVGCYDRTLTAQLSRWSLLKFWRRAQSLSDVLQVKESR